MLISFRSVLTVESEQVDSFAVCFIKILEY